MNDIIAGSPAPTNPTAREQLDFLLHASWQPTRKIEGLLDAYRAEVLAEADADLTRLERELHSRIEYQKAGKARWRARAEKAEPERDALQARLHAVAMTKVWTNEDGKKFVFVEDIAGPLFGLAEAGESRG